MYPFENGVCAANGSYTGIHKIFFMRYGIWGKLQGNNFLNAIMN